MRGQKIIMSVMLGSMMLGMVSPIIASIAQPTTARSADPTRVEQMKAELESTITAAEQAVGGHATAVRLGQSGPQLRWVVGVAATGNDYEVTVERSDGKVSTTVKKIDVATPSTSTERTSAPPRATGEPS